MDHHREHPDWRRDYDARIERRAEVLRRRGNPTPILGALIAEIMEDPDVESEVDR